MASSRKRRTRKENVPAQGGNTFRVHRALEQAKRDLPDVLFRKDKPALNKTSLLDNVSEKKTKVDPGNIREAQKQEGDKPLPAKRTNLSVGDQMKRLDTCKKRPARGKGNGNGRPFVPWCKK